MKTVLLGDLFSIGSSKRVLKSQWRVEGVPFYRGREVTRLANEGRVDNELFIEPKLYDEFKNKYGVPEAGDIVVTAIGTIGNSYIVNKDDKFYFKDASVLWLRKKVSVSSEFINLWLKSPLFKKQIEGDNGATVNTLTIKRLQKVKIDLPSIEEQKRIVKKLDEAFEKIEKAKENTEKNLKNTQELFDSESFSIFSAKNNWEQAQLGDLYIVERGGSPRPIQSYLTNDPEGINWIKIGDVKPGERYITQTKEKIKPEGLKKSRLVKEGDFVLSNSMSFGRPYIMKITGCIHDGWLLIRPKENKITNDFLYYFLSSSYAYKQFDSSAAGSTVRNLNTGLVRKVKIHYPKNSNEQAEIVEKFDMLSRQTQNLKKLYQQKLDDLEELKQSILKDVFSGKL